VLISDAARRRRLARRQLLLPETRVEEVEEVADTLVALHSSDPVSVYLSAAMRLRDPSLADVDRALYDNRTVIRHHALRRTLWVMTPDLARAAHDAFTRKIAAVERARTATLFGCEPDEVDEAIERVVAAVDAAHGPVRTRDLALALPDLAEPIVVNQGTNYAGRMAMHAAVERGRVGEGDLAHVDAWRREWTRRVQETLLDAYFEEIDDAGLIPTGADDRRLLLDVYVLVKALYEIRYELANRPAWVTWPMSAVIGMLPDTGAT
jgi:hypothetical protein